MKYLSIIFFTLALAWTWSVVHSKSEISFETHSGIQEKLAILIRDTVKNKKPSASEIIIEKIWTEVIATGKVKASFIYSFKDNSEEGMISTRIHGHGILDRKEPTEDGLDQWSLSQVQATSDAIEFGDATIVTGNPNSNEPPASSEAQQPELPQSEEQH